MAYNDIYPNHFADKYNNIPYVILDVPSIIPDDNFMEVWQANNVPILRKPDKIDPKYPFTPAEAQAEFIRSGRTNEYTMPNWLGMTAFTTSVADDRWTNSVIDGPTLLPKFFKQLHDYLPIRKLNQVLFWSNQRIIGIHRDLNEQLPFPSSVRLMIHDENTRPTFFLVPMDESASPHELSKHPKEWNHAKFINAGTAASNAFMYNNKQWAHGALKDEGYSKILCSLSIDYDWVKFEELLDRSIARNGNNL